jgi:hypothetical protein
VSITARSAVDLLQLIHCRVCCAILFGTIQWTNSRHIGTARICIWVWRGIRIRIRRRYSHWYRYGHRPYLPLATLLRIRIADVDSSGTYRDLKTTSGTRLVGWCVLNLYSVTGRVCSAVRCVVHYLPEICLCRFFFIS